MPITANYIQPKIEIYLSSDPEDSRTLTIQEARDLHRELSNALNAEYYDLDSKIKEGGGIWRR